ncbi:MAG: acetolactate synthase 2 catalytic subunit [Gammaproteobacteria bacterium]|nr:acetolactate synthase 2 catalytic subunit [Gammaproteobacteria bacterium]MDH3767835.1 acetolactate synthase 2 catalytic subunit [Gammaproteobacteria bacterium]
MNGAQLIVACLETEGTEIVFGYPGGAIMPVYDALYDSSLKHVLVRHEQGAALAADGFARATGKVGVCIATSGPGGTNLVTGIANAFADSVPMVAITGQVATPLMGTDSFQEVDIFGITMPVVKHSFLLRDVADIPRVMREAFRIAAEGRPGPVLIDVPKDVAAAQTDLHPLLAGPQQQVAGADAASIRKAGELVRAARRPVLYAGGGIVIAQAVEAFRQYVELSGIPVVTTLKGLGSVPTRHERCLGMLGMHGTRAANQAVQDADLLVCVGARFDDRATGKLDGFAPKAKVLHMDADPSEVGKLRAADVGLLGDLSKNLAQLPAPVDIEAWQAQCERDKVEHQNRYDAPGTGVYAPALLRQLSEEADERLLLTCDVGQHQMWVAQHCEISSPDRHLTSGGLGTMGFGLPAAIGAQLGTPDACVVCVTGDGSIMMNVQELATIKRYNLPVKIVLLDNSCLGMVRQWQDLFFDGRQSEVDLSDNPDFVRVAESFGIPAFRVDRRDQVDDAIQTILNSDGPVLAHVQIDPAANVWPLVPPGMTNSTMMDEA